MDQETDIDPVADNDEPVEVVVTIERPGWELPEFLAAGLLVTTALLLATSFVAAIIGIFQPLPQSTSSLQLNGYVMVYSTSWATIATSLVVIVALVLCWWQVRQVGQAPDDVSGIARLPRLGWMSSVGGFFLVLLAIGSVATFLGTLFVGGSANSNVAWERYVSVGGQALAVLVLTVFGLIAVQKINDEAEAVLATDDDDVIVVDELDVGDDDPAALTAADDGGGDGGGDYGGTHSDGPPPSDEE